MKVPSWPECSGTLSTVLPGVLLLVLLSPPSVKRSCYSAVSQLPLSSRNAIIYSCVFLPALKGDAKKKKEKKEKRKRKAASRWIASEISSCYIIVLALKTKQNAPNDADRPCFSKHRGCGQRHPHHPTVCSFTPNHGDLLSFGLGIHNAPSSPELCA